MSSELERKVDNLSRRIEKLEKVILDSPSSAKPISGTSKLSLANLSIPSHILGSVEKNVRKISYMDLVLLLMYHSDKPLTYRHLMSLTKELRKPVSYDWLDTEFHRDRYKGLVRSETIAGVKEKAYSLNEPGRKRVEARLKKFEAVH